MKLAPLLLVALAACQNIAGTDNLFLCDAETCPDEGGGSAAGGGSACDTGELEVTVTIVGDIEVEVDSTQEVISSGTTSRCLPAGDVRLRASCSGGSDVDAAWGNSVCPAVDDTCEFSLQKDESFVVDAASACD